MIHVLFICKGNICRSPMAEAVLRERIQAASLSDRIHVDSAAIGNWHVGEAPHPGTLKILRTYHIPSEGLVCRQVKPQDLKEFEYIVAMDEENMAALHRLGTPSHKMFRLLELVDSLPYNDVPDPYYSGRFEETYDLVKAGCQALLATIIKEHHLES